MNHSKPQIKIKLEEKLQMRKIKFRVYNKKKKEWVHGPHENSSLDGVNLFGETILLGGFMDGVPLEELNDCVPLQFTGLKDKNGKEIYEGDIVRYSFESDSGEIITNNLICVYEIINAWFIFNHEKDIADEGYYWLEIKSDCEIIGNIFENEELLRSPERLEN